MTEPPETARWHTVQARVRYADTDAQGIVYYANYLVYMEVGRTDLFRSLGTSYREMEERGVKLVVAEAGLKYRASARYDDLLDIRVRIEELRRRVVRFAYEIREAQTARLFVEGFTVHVSVGPDFRPADLPDWVMELQ
ncbi:MAG: hypothetical protein Kow00129_06120 [Thermoleophilia bacterium]